jgi:hypothetical protein
MDLHRSHAKSMLSCPKDECVDEFANVETLCTHFESVHSTPGVAWEAIGPTSLPSLDEHPLAISPTVQQGCKRSAVESSNPPVAKRARLSSPPAVPSEPALSLASLSLPNSVPNTNASGE